jgi:hypothetical protein
MIFNRVVIAIWLIVSMSFAVLARPIDPVRKSESLPTVEQILNKYSQAIGGKTLSQLTSMYLKGKYTSSSLNLSGSFELYAKTPNKYSRIIEVSNYGIERSGWDGKTAWSENWWARGGQDLDFEPRLFDLTKELSLRKLYPEMRVQAKEKVNGQEAYVIHTMPNTIDHVYLYFDVKTALLIRWRFTTDYKSPTSEGERDFYLNNYKQVSGVRIPFTIICRITLPKENIRRIPGNWIIEITGAEVNKPIDDMKFIKPTTPIRPQKPKQIASGSKEKQNMLEVIPKPVDS